MVKQHGKMQKESTWVILNSCMVQFHPAQLGIMQIQRDDPIYNEVKKHVDPSAF
jgi:hypothetical protein